MERYENRTLNHEEVMSYFLLEYILGIPNKVSQKGLDYYCTSDNRLHIPIAIDLLGIFSTETAMNFDMPNNKAVVSKIYEELSESRKAKIMRVKDFEALRLKLG